LEKEVERLWKEIGKKAEKTKLFEEIHETRALLSHKVDITEFKGVTSKLASSAEVMRLQAQVNISIRSYSISCLCALLVLLCR
jgi:hypothetical protein